MAFSSSTQFRAGMDALISASPGSRVLVASIWNFESLRAAVIAGNPTPTWPLCGSVFNAPPAARALLLDRVVGYNRVLEVECATYANCLFDDYALFDHVWSTAEVSTVDNLHPSAIGQAMISEVEWAAGYRWAVQPASKGDCTNGRWTSLVDGQGRSFKNQGDCVSYVATGGKK